MEENAIQIESRIMINVDECKKHNIPEKYYIWNPATCSCKNCKYLANTLNDLVIACDEIIDTDAKSYNKETKTIPKI